MEENILGWSEICLTLGTLLKNTVCYPGQGGRHPALGVICYHITMVPSVKQNYRGLGKGDWKTYLKEAPHRYTSKIWGLVFVEHHVFVDWMYVSLTIM